MTGDDRRLPALQSLPKSKFAIGPGISSQKHEKSPENRQTSWKTYLQFIFLFLVFLLVPFLLAILCNFKHRRRCRTSTSSPLKRFLASRVGVRERLLSLGDTLRRKGFLAMFQGPIRARRWRAYVRKTARYGFRLLAFPL
jgi:hypothetical protein